MNKHAITGNRNAVPRNSGTRKMRFFAIQRFEQDQAEAAQWQLEDQGRHRERQSERAPASAIPKGANRARPMHK